MNNILDLRRRVAVELEGVTLVEDYDKNGTVTGLSHLVWDSDEQMNFKAEYVPDTHDHTARIMEKVLGDPNRGQNHDKWEKFITAINPYAASGYSPISIAKSVLWASPEQKLRALLAVVGKGEEA